VISPTAIGLESDIFLHYHCHSSLSQSRIQLPLHYLPVDGTYTARSPSSSSRREDRCLPTAGASAAAASSGSSASRRCRHFLAPMEAVGRTSCPPDPWPGHLERVGELHSAAFSSYETSWLIEASAYGRRRGSPASAGWPTRESPGAVDALSHLIRRGHNSYRRSPLSWG
jgi:hypothetical protein